MNAIILILAGLIFMAAVMTSAWLTQRRTGNGGWIDVFWTLGTGVTGVAFALAPLDGVTPPSWRQEIIALLIALWSLRLGGYVAYRVATGPEDGRYVALKAEWGADFQRRAFWFIEVQAPISVLLGIAVLVAAHNPVPQFRLMDAAAIAVLVIAIAGEATADRQLQRFKKDPQHRGRICDEGLWRYSRHPNYFFEWLLWWSFPLFAIDIGSQWVWGWAALLAPTMMFWILTRLTGIPLTEKLMEEKRGDAFRRYRDRTSAFIPLPPRHPVSGGAYGRQS